jgi:hypothetical protein
MKGRRDARKKDKWKALTTLIRKQRVAILGIQEAHLNMEETDRVNNSNPKVIVINNGVSTTKEGIAFVLNKDLINETEWNHTVLIEGRASRLQIRVEEERGLDIILIYSPNTDKDKIEFWKTLNNKLEEQEGMNNVIIMGDFNSVENPIDRYPHRADEKKVTDEWDKIRLKYKVTDGWREHNPITKDYTYIQKTTESMSRIDRIYMNEEIFPYGYNWAHVSSAKISDHEMVVADILKSKLPYIGEGMWRMYQDDIDNETMILRINKILKETQKNMREIKNKQSEGEETEKSIQRIWMETKIEIKRTAIRTRKERKKQVEREKNVIKRKITETLEKLSDEMEETRVEYAKKITELKMELARKTRTEIKRLQESTKARYRVKGEKYTKYWFRINKEKINENIILGLKDKNEKLTTKTKEMMEIAVNHHEKLQEKPEMTMERENAIEKLKETSTKKLEDEDKKKLEKKTTKEEISEAIKKAPNGTSPGIDGIPYELYKKMIKRKEENKKEEVDMIEILHSVIEDIEVKGLEILTRKEKSHEMEFTDGIMFLLYKKKEKYKIENYRPLTLLNTDYKIYTKTIAKRLAEVAPGMIHEDQAGFVPKRSLYDHTKTTHLVIEYCEMVGMNGCIIALDQEKAYDKIDHDYLWEILEHNGFPKIFIDRIKEMYKNTGKAIMINGVITRQFKVKRGVHQGDPMSCLLYNFAIEPLAEAIRKSKLKGLKINEKINRLIVNLFADDTLVYLSEKDDIKKLEEIIDTFCKASTAKFNMEKTEYLPIGSKEFRKKLITERTMGENKIEEKIKIIKEGESMRTLGAWVGNYRDDGIQWERIIKSQEKVIERWAKMNMSLKGKEIVLKALVQSKAIFLATVNGISQDVEKRMTKMYKDFVWNEKKKGLMSWEQIIAPRTKGGLGMPDLKSRIEAIEIMWLKKWLSPEEKRPKWAHIVDEILNENITKNPMIDRENRKSWILQSWHESESKESKISGNIRRMLKIARKYNVTVKAPKYEKEIKENMILWHNSMIKGANYQWNKKSSRCLRDLHAIETIGDLFMERISEGDHEPCDKMAEILKSKIPDIINPTLGTPRKVKEKNLDHTPRRIKQNKERSDKKVFNPDVTAKGDIMEYVRLFGKEKGPKTRGNEVETPEPAYRNQVNEKGKKTRAKMVILVCNKGRSNEQIKVSIKMKGNTNKKQMFGIREGGTIQEAKATGILWILLNEKEAEIKIATDDKSIIKWIGERIQEEESNAWIGTEEKEIWIKVLKQLRKRGERTQVRMAKKGGILESKLRKMKKELEQETVGVAVVNNERESKFINQGAKLRTLTQKTAYELALRENMTYPGGQATSENMDKIMHRIANKWDVKTSEYEIWKGLQKIEQPQIRDFIWKMIHGRIKCGPFFRFIPRWSDKEFCRCGKSETIEHILLRCEETGQKKLWEVIGKIWEETTKIKFERPEIGDVMGIGQIKIRTSMGESKGITELYKTIVTTAVWSIWKNRNKRIFEEELETEEMQIGTWREMIENETKIEKLSIDIKGNREKARKAFIEKWKETETFEEEE